MKKIVLIFTLFFFGCKTKQVESQKQKTENQTDITAQASATEQAQNTTTIQANESEVKELITLLQSFQIGYDGKDISDKLDFLLKRTEKGTQITISGKGTANLVESQMSNVESLKKDLYTRQDSLHRAELQALQSLKAEIYKLQKNKEKEVNSKDFTLNMYLWAFGIFALIIVLFFLQKWIKQTFNI